MLIKKIIISLFLSLGLFGVAFASNSEDINSRNVKPFLPIPDDLYRNEFVNVPDTTEKSSIGKSQVLVANFAFVVQLLVGAITSFLVITSAISMLAQGTDSEEGLTSLKNTITYAVIGVGLIMLSSEIAKILSLEAGGIIGPKDQVLNRVQVFEKNVDVIMTLIRYLLGGAAILFITISGARMIGAGGSEEDSAKEKKNITFVSIGLVAFLMLENFLGNIIYNINSPFMDPSISPSKAVSELIGFTNLVVSFMGPIAIISVIIGGVLYAFSGIDEEQAAKAKRLIAVSLGGIILIYGAFSIISTIVAGQF